VPTRSFRGGMSPRLDDTNESTLRFFKDEGKEKSLRQISDEAGYDPAR